MHKDLASTPSNTLTHAHIHEQKHTLSLTHTQHEREGGEDAERDTEKDRVKERDIDKDFHSFD